MKNILNLFILLLAFNIRLLPFSIIVYLTRFLSSFFFICGVRKKVISKNLNIVFGDTKEKEEKKALMKKIYFHIILVFFECLRSIFMTKKTLKKYVHIDKEALKVFKRDENGIILYLHMGNWEFGSFAFAFNNIDIGVLVKRIKNIDMLFLQKYLRRIAKEKCFIKGEPHLASKIIRFIKKSFLVTVIDQSATKIQGVPFKIFSQEAFVYHFPYTLAKKNKVPIYFTYMVRDKDLKNHSLKIVSLKNVDMKIVYKKFEEILLKYPEQWFWMHDFWKKRI